MKHIALGKMYIWKSKSPANTRNWEQGNSFENLQPVEFKIPIFRDLKFPFVDACGLKAKLHLVCCHRFSKSCLYATTVTFSCITTMMENSGGYKWLENTKSKLQLLSPCNLRFSTFLLCPFGLSQSILNCIGFGCTLAPHTYSRSDFPLY